MVNFSLTFVTRYSLSPHVIYDYSFCRLALVKLCELSHSMLWDHFGVNLLPLQVLLWTFISECSMTCNAISFNMLLFSAEMSGSSLFLGLVLCRPPCFSLPPTTLVYHVFLWWPSPMFPWLLTCILFFYSWLACRHVFFSLSSCLHWCGYMPVPCPDLRVFPLLSHKGNCLAWLCHHPCYLLLPTCPWFCSPSCVASHVWFLSWSVSTFAAHWCSFPTCFHALCVVSLPAIITTLLALHCGPLSLFSFFLVPLWLYMSLLRVIHTVCTPLYCLSFLSPCLCLLGCTACLHTLLVDEPFYDILPLYHHHVYCAY